GRGERGGDRLHVAHLADEDDVRVLAQRSLQRVGEAQRIRPDLALVDDAALVPVHELDRVLDGEDVLRPVAVDLVEDGGECRRLTGAGGARDEDDAARLLRERMEDGREAELLERLDLLRDKAEGGADGLALVVDVDAEARDTGQRIGKVELALLFEDLLLLARENPVEKRPRVVGRQRVEALGAQDLPAYAVDRRA